MITDITIGPWRRSRAYAYCLISFPPICAEKHAGRTTSGGRPPRRKKELPFSPRNHYTGVSHSRCVCACASRFIVGHLSRRENPDRRRRSRISHLRRTRTSTGDRTDNVEETRILPRDSFLPRYRDFLPPSGNRFRFVSCDWRTRDFLFLRFLLLFFLALGSASAHRVCRAQRERNRTCMGQSPLETIAPPCDSPDYVFHY